MTPTRSNRPAAAALSSAWSVAVAGAVALAVAMGIGRFAFTPLLPMMLADGVVDLHAASRLATANYLGYLSGALLCTFQPWIWARATWLPPIDGPWLVRGGLVATGVLTLGMGLPWVAAWPALRFAAGVASALVFVYASAWCLGELARRQKPGLGGAIFTGPGAGIVLSGLFASVMVAWQWPASTGWLIFGALALLLTAGVWRTLRSEHEEDAAAGAGSMHASADAAAAVATPAVAAVPVAADAGAPQAAAAGVATPAPAATRPLVVHGTLEVAALTVAYGLAGLGYIVTATFLPVIARQALPGSGWIDFFWPIFGAGVVVGALLATRVRVTGDLRLWLAGSYAMQVTGIAASLVSPTLAGFAVGSLLLGLPFTAITFFAIQEVRRVRPHSVRSTTGALTALWSIGQTAGPPLASWLLLRTGSAAAGFTLALEVAASSLVLGALLFLWMSRAYPKV